MKWFATLLFLIYVAVCIGYVTRLLILALYRRVLCRVHSGAECRRPWGDWNAR